VEEQFYTYILESLTDGTYYIGSTKDIEDRITRHNSGRSKYTKSKRPWKIIFTRAFPSRAEAVQLELYLKKKKNRKRIRHWILSQQ
jgi:putative endonuclease